jgi:transcriptional regulator with XRE-family HTH domain
MADKYKTENQEIRILQNNLKTIRTILNWTLEELADKIGVTKQTISNLENIKTEMTKMQYIAIRTILDYEVATVEKDNGLAEVLTLLFDDEKQLKEPISENKRSDAAKVIASATSSGVATSVIFPALLPLIGTVAVGILTSSPRTKVKVGHWIKNLLR